jgi:enoyl-CoA hydratase/carnithine racemase
MTDDQIRCLVSDQIMTITLTRPERLNAMTETMRAKLIRCLDRADADPDVRVVVVTGDGRAFCAGTDLAAKGAGATFRYPDPARHVDGAGVLALRIFESTKPVIGAINGAAVGAGATMLLPMDIRLASRTARIGFPFARRGITPDGASSWFLPRLVGISRAMEWVATGRLFGADEALAAGLVRSLHEPDQLMAAAYELATEIAANTSAVSVALSRQLQWRMLGADHPMAAHEVESRLLGAVGSAPDAVEGVQAFLEKRPAKFPGRVPDDLPDWYPWWAPRLFEPVP